MKRCGIFWVSQELLWEFFAGLVDHSILAAKVRADLPADARLCDVAYDPLRNCFGFKLEHEIFPGVHEGELWPNLNFASLGPPKIDAERATCRQCQGGTGLWFCSEKCVGDFYLALPVGDGVNTIGKMLRMQPIPAEATAGEFVSTAPVYYQSLLPVPIESDHIVTS